MQENKQFTAKVLERVKTANGLFAQVLNEYLANVGRLMGPTSDGFFLYRDLDEELQIAWWI